MMNRILVLCLLASSSAFGLNEYFSISKSIRSLGMGGAFYALSDDEYALFYNPAGLSNYRGEGQFMGSLNVNASAASLSGISQLQGLQGGSVSSTVNSLQTFQGKPMYVGVGLFPFYLNKNFAIGMLIGDTKADIAILGRDIDTSVDVTAISDTALVVGYGRKIVNDDLHVGFNFKGVVRAGGQKSFTALDIAQGDGLNFELTELGGAGAGIDLDLGAIYDIRGLPFGDLNQVSLTFSNLLASELNMVKVEGTPPRLVRMMSLGARSVFPGYGIIDNFHVMLDLAEFGIGGESNEHFGARGGSFWKHVNFGVEMPIHGWFVMRSGFRQGNFTAGFGVRTSLFQLDFATYAEEMLQGVGRLTNRRYALRLAIGAGAPPPPVVEPKGYYYQQEKQLDEQEKKTNKDLEKRKDVEKELELESQPKPAAPAVPVEAPPAPSETPAEVPTAETPPSN